MAGDTDARAGLKLMQTHIHSMAILAKALSLLFSSTYFIAPFWVSFQFVAECSLEVLMQVLQLVARRQ